MITVSDPLVADLITFEEEICARSPGWYRATCRDDAHDWYTTGYESTVEDAAYEHVEEEHRQVFPGRHRKAEHRAE